MFIVMNVFFFSSISCSKEWADFKDVHSNLKKGLRLEIYDQEMS